MIKTPNAQYNVARPESFAIRIANNSRFAMYRMFEKTFPPTEENFLLDVGVTSDDQYASSNYFELLYPHKHRITAAGIDDASFLETRYPGLKFVHANALTLPFEDGAFDYVHSSAVLEHVGNFANQKRMIAECVRVARKGVFLTTPNRWFPVEFHTQLPLLHWLPKPWFRSILSGLGQHELAREENLNLMTAGELRRAAPVAKDWNFRIVHHRLLGLNSNLILIGRPGS